MQVCGSYNPLRDLVQVESADVFAPPSPLQLSFKTVLEIRQPLTLLSLQIVIYMKQNSSHRDSHYQTAHTVVLWIITGVDGDVLTRLQ